MSRGSSADLGRKHVVLQLHDVLVGTYQLFFGFRSPYKNELHHVVTHNGPTTPHRIDQIEVEVTNSTGSAMYMVPPPPGLQPVTFTVTYGLVPITEVNTIMSRANCNVHGWSGTEMLTLNPKADTPSSPRDLQVDAGDGPASLTWRVPVDDGGSSVTSYNVYLGPSNGSESLLTILGNVQRFVDTGLTNDQIYFNG